MEENRIERLDQVRHWIRSLDKRPGVYLIENTVNGACYVGSATKSLRQRLRDTLATLNSGRHHSYLLQADWQRFGAKNFAWWGSYALSAADALAAEKELAIAANAFEDYGGYCQRTGENCIAASFRETERKLAKARVRRYQFLPGVRVEDRVSELLLRTASRRKPNQQHSGDLQKGSCTGLAAWKALALCCGQFGEMPGVGLTAQGAMCDFLDRRSAV